MRTVIVTRFGGPEVLELRDVADPPVGPGQSVIEVEYAEVIFLDSQLRAGWGQAFFPMRPPFVPGMGVAGTSGGRRVVARTSNDGGYAERVVVPAAEMIDIPRGVDSAEALAALHDGVLALDRLEHASLREGAHVLVTAAAGSLGHWFVPLAKAAGATVTGAAGGPAKVEAVRAMGADVAVDYRGHGWIDAAAGPFDVVFDGVGGEIGRTAYAATVDGGTFYAHGAASGDFATDESVRGITVVGVERSVDDENWRRLVRTGLGLIADGDVVPVIGQRVPLEEAGRAHEAMERRAVIGKTVLVI